MTTNNNNNNNNKNTFATKYYTIDPQESLTFFMGSWQELQLKEFDGDNSTDGTDFNLSKSSSNNFNASYDSIGKSPMTKKKNLLLSNEQPNLIIPADWFDNDESTTSNNNNNKTPIKKKKSTINTTTTGVAKSPRPVLPRSKSPRPVLPRSQSPKPSQTRTSPKPLLPRSPKPNNNFNDNTTELQHSKPKTGILRSPCKTKSKQQQGIHNSSRDSYDYSNNSKKPENEKKQNYFDEEEEQLKTPTMKKDPKEKFYQILNINPYHGETIPSNKVKRLVTLIKEYPHYCQEKYIFDAFSDYNNNNATIYPLHMLCAIAAPIICIKRCYQAYPEAINDTTTSPLGTVVHYACAFHYHYYQSGSDNGDDNNNNNEGDNTNNTLIKKSVSGNTLAVVKYLINKNSNMLRILNEKDRQTALHLACSAPYFVNENNNKDVDLLNNNNNESLDDMNNSKDISVVMEKDNQDYSAEIVQYLTEICIQLTTVRDNNKNTPLHIACLSDNPILSRIQHLCTIAPQTCLAMNNTYSTPLHITVSNNNNNNSNTNTKGNNKIGSKIVKQLINTPCGESALHMIDQNGYLPIHVAIRSKNENIKIYKTLIKGYPECIDMPMDNNKKPYQYAKSLSLSNAILELLLCDTKK